jgi:hypothetical protein
MSAGILRRIGRKVDSNAVLFTIVAVGMASIIFCVLFYALLFEIVLITKRSIHRRKVRRYRLKIKHIATPVKVPCLPTWVETHQYAQTLQEWCDGVEVKLYWLNGKIFQKLPVEGRVVIVDIEPGVGSNYLFFLKKTDATLYKLSF